MPSRRGYAWALAAIAVLWLLLRRDATLLQRIKDYLRFGGGGSPRKKIHPGKVHPGPMDKPTKADKKTAVKSSVMDAVRSLGLDISEEDILRIFPRRYELHDHVVVVKMNHGVDLATFAPLAAAFAASLLSSIDVVIADTEGITGELRRPVHTVVYRKEKTGGTQLRLIHKFVTKRYKGKTCLGDTVSEGEVAALEALASSPTFTVHVENDVKYCFDVMRVMFCSGNTTERMHFATINAGGERVVDMFAGIGYFTLPLAMRGGVMEVIALEKNPDSCTYLRLNALVNGVGDKVQIVCGDNRIVTGSTFEGMCDRVLMGYIPTCETFLPRAFSFLRRGTGSSRLGIIHYHFNAGEKRDAYRCAYRHVVEQLGEDVVGTFEIEDLRQVKSYAPRTWHYVADVRFK